MAYLKKMWAGVLRVVYALAHPLIGLVLHGTSRVRVVVLCGNKILLQRSALGSQRWSLPGGGIGRKETTEQAAVRETFEETGVVVQESQVTAIGTREPHEQHGWPRIHAEFVSTRVRKIQTPKIRQPWEVLEVQWFPLDELPDNRMPSVDVGIEFLTN